MFGRNRGDRGALVALTVIVTAVVIIFLFGGFDNPTNQIVEHHAQPDGGGKDGQSKAVEAVYWGVFTARDTFAQWIAAIAAIGSVGVSIWAVRLVGESLGETRKTTHAAIDANRLAKEQMAPNLRFVGGRYEIDPWGVKATVRLKTVGNSIPLFVSSYATLRYPLPQPRIGYNSDWYETRYTDCLEGYYAYEVESAEFHGIVASASHFDLPKIAIWKLNQRPHFTNIECLVWWEDNFSDHRGCAFNLSLGMEDETVDVDDGGEATISGRLYVGEIKFLSGDALFEAKNKYKDQGGE